MAQTIRDRVYHVLETSEGAKFDNYILSTMIILNVTAAVVETLPSMRPYAWLFRLFEQISVAIFSVEYLLRVWVSVCNRRYSGPLRGRLRYILSPLALIDLLAILPFYLPFLGIDLRFLRLLRLLRIFKLARYSTALQTMGNIFWAKRDELLLTLVATIILLVFASSMVYYVENEAQPKAFSSIPAALWWGVATVTTVGYGDIYPVTPIGKLLTGIIALLGVGLFALPAGILAGGFTEELQQRRQKKAREQASHYCPHCGQPVPDHHHPPQ